MLKNKSTRILYDREGKEGLPDGIISTDDEDEDDNDADDGGATKLLPHVYSFFGAAAAPDATRRPWRRPDRGGRGRVVAEAIRRTEATAAARYERALTSVLQTLEPTLAAGEQAQERARRAWVGAGRMWEDPP